MKHNNPPRPPQFPKTFWVASYVPEAWVVKCCTESQGRRNKDADNFEEYWSESENKLKPGVCPNMTEISRF